MGKVAIVTGGEKKDVCAMAVLAMNIAEVSPNIADELVIYHDGISEMDKSIINRIYPTRFIDFSFPIKLLDKICNSSLRGFSEMVFYKYEFLNLLKEYDQVIFTDYDILILKDLSELKIKKGLNMFKGEPLEKKLWRTPLPCRNAQNQWCYSLCEPGISAALIVASTDWKSQAELERMYKRCVELTYRYARYIKCPEECILSMLIQEESLDYNPLDKSRYVVPYRKRDSAASASILHAVGRPKFWDGLYDETWNTRYQKWLQLGGSPYHEPLKRRLIRYTYDISVRKMIKKAFNK